MDLSNATTEDLLRELIRRNPRHFPAPSRRAAEGTREYLFAIGKDHHCVLSMWDEAAATLGVA